MAFLVHSIKNSLSKLFIEFCFFVSSYFVLEMEGFVSVFTLSKYIEDVDHLVLIKRFLQVCHFSGGIGANVLCYNMP